MLLHAEQLLLRHGVGAPALPKATNSACPKVGAGVGWGGGVRHSPGADGASLSQLYFHQDPQDLVLGGDMPISSIQATIAKLSIKPGGASGELDPVPPPNAEAEVMPPALPEGVVDGVVDGVGAPEPPPLVPALLPQPPADLPSTNHTAENPEASSRGEEAVVPPAAPSSTSSSSLELLASLTPEAFSLDASLKGKQRMNKQNFLQPQTGEGLRGPRPSDDPLSMLDPLWTLNKT